MDSKYATTTSKNTMTFYCTPVVNPKKTITFSEFMEAYRFFAEQAFPGIDLFSERIQID